MGKYLGLKLTQAHPQVKNGVDGYRVVYEMWCTKSEFENAYQLIEGMSFGLALEAMKDGYKLTRKDWPQGKYIVYNDGNLYLHTPDGEADAWSPDGVEVLTNDWNVVEGSL